MYILTDDSLTWKVNETFIFFQGVGGNELTSETKLNIKNWQKYVYIMRWILEIYITKINFQNICVVSVYYLIFWMVSPKRQIIQIYSLTLTSIHVGYFLHEFEFIFSIISTCMLLVIFGFVWRWLILYITVTYI